MFQLILRLSKLFFREPCSVQREILNRLQKKRSAWDSSNDELLDIYEYLNSIIKKRTGVGTITPKEFVLLMKYPASSLNFVSGKKVPLNDLERFRVEFVKSIS
jgi:hypothetical protein